MGARMGIFRVAKAIKILGHVFGWITLVVFVVIAFMEPGNRIGPIGIGLVIAGVVIGIGHGAAWIIEGFAPEQ